jgi:hypothetical protein
MPVYDYNGQIFEMDETDPAAARAKIQAALGETPATQTPPAQEFGGQEVAQLTAPVVSAIAPGPTGAGQLISDIKGAGVIEPLAQSIKGRVGEYIAKPAKAVIDAATMLTTGIPGAAPAALYDTYKAAQEAVPRMKQALGALDLDRTLFMNLADKLNSAELDQLSKLVGNVGGKAALEAFKLPERLASDPAAVQAFNTLRSQAQATPGMISKLGMPLLRGAAKVAGPVGLGMDIYQAQQFAEESKLGPRLAQGEGRKAQQAFRNMAANTQYGGLTPQEQRILEQDRIDQEIRRKAASRVSGPIAPGR